MQRLKPARVVKEPMNIQLVIFILSDLVLIHSMKFLKQKRNKAENLQNIGKRLKLPAKRAGFIFFLCRHIERNFFSRS